MNAIRRQVSRIKGGRLALAAHPAPVVSLVVSDVPGDDPAQVASGPTVPSPGSRAAARDLVRTWRIALPPAVAAHLDGDHDPAPDPADPRFAANSVTVIASARLSLEAAAARARADGLPAVILSDAIEGEARDVGRVHAAILREVALRDRPFARPVAILSGGETTVTLRGPNGRGGRNTEFLLALALAAEGLPFAALAADTDGIDGTEANAGAFADGASMARLRAQGADPAALLAANDAWGAFDALGDLFSPGPTGTNVNDFRAILLRP
jgi:hydroxypyruvate reductase